MLVDHSIAEVSFLGIFAPSSVKLELHSPETQRLDQAHEHK